MCARLSAYPRQVPPESKPWGRIRLRATPIEALDRDFRERKKRLMLGIEAPPRGRPNGCWPGQSQVCRTRVPTLLSALLRACRLDRARCTVQFPAIPHYLENQRHPPLALVIETLHTKLPSRRTFVKDETR